MEAVGLLKISVVRFLQALRIHPWVFNMSSKLAFITFMYTKTERRVNMYSI